MFWMLALTLATLIQLGYWLGIFARLAAASRSTSVVPQDRSPQPVSVIICARNEAANLQRHLPHFLHQDYPHYELIVVDDNSSDDSAKIVWQFQQRFPILRLISLTEVSPPGKKRALEVGIRAASFDTILLSDADCWPASPHWISRTLAALLPDHDLALGYSPYLRTDGWLNRFQRFETVYTAIQYFSFAIFGLPYMGVGRNLAYRRDLFFRQRGFDAHAHLASGDDDLLVNAAASQARITWVLEREAFVYSLPTRSWKRYYYQKYRHTTAGSHYRRHHQWMLGALSLSHALHYLLSVVVLWNGGPWQFVLLMYTVRIGVVACIWYGVTRRLGDRDLLAWLPLLDFLLLLYYFLFAPALLIQKSHERWK